MYSPYQGQPSQRPYAYAPAPASYDSPQGSNPTSIVENVLTTNRSFEQNASSIPGLGMSGGLAAASCRVENHAQWQQEKYGDPSSASRVVKSRGKGANGAQQQRQPHGAARSSPLAVQHVPIQQEDTLEEGELSESQFEDLYEPRGPEEVVFNKPDTTAMDRPGSVGDTDGSSIYDTGSTRKEMMVDSTSAPLPAAEAGGYSPGEYYEPESPSRDRSRSYSPYLSPREVREETSVTKVKPLAPKQLEALHTSTEGFASPDTPLKQQPDTISCANGQVPLNQNQNSHLLSKTSNGTAPPVPGLPYKSVSEAKKKAQEAILGLWPLKVRFQDYVEEGFDDALVKSLFSELGLDTSPPKVVASTTPSQRYTDSQNPLAAPSPSITTTVSKTLQTTDKTFTSSQPAKSNTTKPVHKREAIMADKKAGEERKDKIARMLAEKSKKSTTANAVPVATPAAPAPAPTSNLVPNLSESPVQDKAKIKAQNNLKLQQKIEALKKAQEEAKKAEAKKQQDEPKQLASASTVDTPIKSSTPAQVASAPVAPTPQRPDRDSSSGDNEAAGTPAGIPGLFLSSTPQPISKARNLKRPVASDFDGYPANGGTLKRTRTQQTLIIDVSDDEDVEMELGSPTTDVAISAVQPNNTLTRQNSLGSFPPLSNSHNNWRHKSSPAPSAAQTPPEHGNKLDFLHKQIEEAKKKIAEREAKTKKAVKRPSGASTPMAQTPATPAALEPVKLPKPYEVAQAPKSRAASCQLPVSEAVIREKKDRLKRLHMEIAQLELELQVDMAERQNSTDDDLAEMRNGTEAEPADVDNGAQAVNTDSKNTPQPPESVPSAQAEVRPGSVILPQEMEMQPELESPGDKSDMEIDSSTPSADASANVNTGPNSSGVAGNENKCVSDEISNADHTTQKMPNGNNASVANHTVTSTNSTPDITGKQSTDQVAPETDISMQTSAAESDVDTYEPMPAQISSTDKVQVLGDEEGEIPDEDPYEPNPAQVLDAVPDGATAPSSSETEKMPVICSEDLLSYKSPLRYFHAYRFHPKYLEHVPGGLKSMTYSSRIDPFLEVCPNSINGVKCPNGPSCKFQHFENMELSGTDIITQLGSSDAYTGEQKTRFIDGLKKVLNDLKANKVKDFDQITRAIVKFRADFLEDPSRILPLNGVTI